MDNGVAEPALFYYNIGNEQWELTDVGAKMIKLVYFVNPGTRL